MWVVLDRGTQQHCMNRKGPQNTSRSSKHRNCWPEFFEKFVSGERTFELRLADFDLLICYNKIYEFTHALI